jgi:hypothetical protein
MVWFHKGKGSLRAGRPGRYAGKVGVAGPASSVDSEGMADLVALSAWERCGKAAGNPLALTSSNSKSKYPGDIPASIATTPYSRSTALLPCHIDSMGTKWAQTQCTALQHSRYVAVIHRDNVAKRFSGGDAGTLHSYISAPHGDSAGSDALTALFLCGIETRPAILPRGKETGHRCFEVPYPSTPLYHSVHVSGGPS